ALSLCGRRRGEAMVRPPIVRTVLLLIKPDMAHVSTSYSERANLTMRMHNRRFTRLTNAFSKKFENHAHMVAIYAVWYNFLRIHTTLRVTPSMAAGLCQTVMDWSDIVEAMDADAPSPKRGPYKKATAKFQTERHQPGVETLHAGLS